METGTAKTTTTVTANHSKGKNLVTITGEGYKLNRSSKRQRYSPDYINADVKSGKRCWCGRCMPTDYWDIPLMPTDRRDVKGKVRKVKVLSMAHTDYMIDAQYEKGWDEWSYLASFKFYQAVQKGDFKSGLDHYKKYGMSEGRHYQFTSASDDFDEIFYLMTYTDARILFLKESSKMVHTTICWCKRGTLQMHLVEQSSQKVLG